MTQSHETPTPAPENDPAENWIKYAEEQNTAPIPKDPTDTTEIPRIPHGHDPITEVPDYTRNTPLKQVENDLETPESPAALEVTPPKIKAREAHWYDSTRNKILSGVGALVAVSLVAFGISEATGGDDKPAPKSPSAAGTLKPGQAGIEAAPTESSAPVSGPAEASQAPIPTMPNTITEHYMTQTGNIAPGNLDPRHAITIDWAGEEMIDALPEPGAAPNDVATGALSLFAAAISFKPDTPNWDKAVAALTPEGTPGQFLRDDLRKWNAEFQNAQGKPYTERAMFFDSKDAPADFTVSTNEVGNTVYTLSSGTLYERRLLNTAKLDKEAGQRLNFDDIQAYSPLDARVISGFEFTTYRMPDGTERVLDIKFSYKPYQPPVE
jgi:hypothetical protein